MKTELENDYETGGSSDRHVEQLLRPMLKPIPPSLSPIDLSQQVPCDCQE